MRVHTRRLTRLAAAVGLTAPLLVAGSTTIATGAGTAIPIGPGSDFTVLSRTTTTDPLALRTDGPVDIEFSEMRIDPGGTTGLLARQGLLVVSVDDGNATMLLAGADDCLTRTAAGGSAVIRPRGSVSEIRNAGSTALTLHLTSLTPTGTVAPTTAPGSCPATTAKGVTTKVLNRSTITAPMTADASGTSDVYVGVVRAEPGRSAGPWHAHPAPVIGAVDQSQVTIKIAHGDRCEVLTAPAGSGFLEMPGMVHEASNRSDRPLRFYILGFAPSPQPLLAPRPTPAECQNA